MDMNSFANMFGKKIDKIEKSIDAFVHKFATRVVLNLVHETPIDTGRAKSNWIVSIGDSISKTIPAYMPGRFGSTSSENIDAAISAASTVLAQYRSGQGIYISNSLPYIRRLNEGYSLQAPAMFVEASILQSRREIFSKNLELSR